MILRFFLFALLIAALASCGDKEEKPVKAKPDAVAKSQKEKKELKPGLVYSYELIRPKKNQYEDSRIRIGDSLVYCSHKGKIDLADSSGNSRINIIDLKSEYLVDRMHILPRGDSRWLIFWHETYQQGQKTNMAVYRQGTVEPEWKISFPHTNAGPVVLDGQMCYFTMMGMVGKIDITNGKMQWQVDSLFNQLKWSYKRFEVPRVYKNKVVFIDYPERGRRDKRDTLVLDPATGKRKK